MHTNGLEKAALDEKRPLVCNIGYSLYGLCLYPLSTTVADRNAAMTKGLVRGAGQ